MQVATVFFSSISDVSAKRCSRFGTRETRTATRLPLWGHDPSAVRLLLS
jgi:hypothetical protein